MMRLRLGCPRLLALIHRLTSLSLTQVEARMLSLATLAQQQVA